MKKKNLKNLVLTKETISKINPTIVYGGVKNGRPTELPQPPIDTIRIPPTTRIPVDVSRAITVQQTNCASVCFECQ
ncbi:hypothetical protein H2O64_13370 [Kordia sp. YSTF-M3]|uniref:Uncharacterized protein n=1 Tax=Kordia aestuariivivens TaxID=2759037 RepID=A0ABR7QAV5_9FLAO|nr:hypothetical protein [Kordia aestuariivivens]MBC8755662.1 hypothetical protein [Kordia aestuariivivens]